MSVEIYDNYYPKKAAHVDARLATVTTVALLPDPTVAANFLYEGAVAYVAGTVEKHYKCVMNVGNTALEWVLYDSSALVIGTINITPATSSLDLALVSPAIANCYAVKINVVGGISASLQSIVNMPGSDKLITFYVTAGQDVNFKHVDYDAAAPSQIVLENGFDLLLKGRAIGDESLTLKLHGTALCQWDATQFMKSTEWLTNLLNIAIVDNLTTSDADKALSANQGVVIKSLIDTKQNILTAGEKITVVPGTLATDPHTINNDPRDWLNITPTTPVVITDLDAYIVSITIVFSIEYRYLDLRNFGTNANQGLWMLPPKKDPTVLGNWINMDLSAATALGDSVIKFKPTSLASATTNIHLTLDETNVLGSNPGFTFTNNTGLTPTIKDKVFFNSAGTYVVDVQIVLSAAMLDSAELENFMMIIAQYLDTTSGASGDSFKSNVPEFLLVGTTSTIEAVVRHSYLLEGTPGVLAFNGVDLTGFSVRINNRSIGNGDFTKINFLDARSLIKISKIA